MKAPGSDGFLKQNPEAPAAQPAEDLVSVIIVTFNGEDYIEACLKSILDLKLREKIVLYPLLVLTLVFGFYPAPILDTTASAVDNLVSHYSTAIGRDPAVDLADQRIQLEYAAPLGEAQPAAAPASH